MLGNRTWIKFPLLLLHFNSLFFRSQIQHHFLKNFFLPRQQQAHVPFRAIACYPSSKNSTAFIIYQISIFQATLEFPRGRHSYSILLLTFVFPEPSSTISQQPPYLVPATILSQTQALFSSFMALILSCLHIIYLYVCLYNGFFFFFSLNSEHHKGSH